MKAKQTNFEEPAPQHYHTLPSKSVDKLPLAMVTNDGCRLIFATFWAALLNHLSDMDWLLESAVFDSVHATTAQKLATRATEKVFLDHCDPMGLCQDHDKVVSVHLLVFRKFLHTK